MAERKGDGIPMTLLGVDALELRGSLEVSELWDIDEITQALGAQRIDRVDRRTGRASSHHLILFNAAKWNADGTLATPKLHFDKAAETVKYSDGGGNPAKFVNGISGVGIEDDRVVIKGENDSTFQTLEIKRDGSYTESVTVKDQAYDRLRWEPVRDDERQQIYDDILRDY